jgi:hypothetical protein
VAKKVPSRQFFTHHIDRIANDPLSGDALSIRLAAQSCTSYKCNDPDVVYGTIYKVRRMAQLLAPDRDFTWLSEIDKDLALVMVPRSKFGRLIYANVLVDAGVQRFIGQRLAVPDNSATDSNLPILSGSAAPQRSSIRKLLPSIHPNFASASRKVII